MAITAVSHNQWESYSAFLQESTFLTPNGASSNFTIFDIIDGSAPIVNDDGAFVDSRMRKNGSNFKDEADFFTQKSGVWRTVVIPEFVCPSDVLAHLVYGAVQNVSEAATTPYLKTYTMDGTADPNFAGDAGYFFTYVVKNAISGKDHQLASCVIQNLTISFDASQAGRCRVACTLLSGGAFDDEVTLSGTNAYSGRAVPSKLNSNTSNLSIDGQDLVWNSIQIQINSRYDWIGRVTPDNYKYLGSEILVNANVKWDANVGTMYENGAKSKVTGLDFDLASTGTAGHFGISCNDAYIHSANINRGDANTVQSMDISLEVLRDASASQNPIITIADDVDQTW